MAHNHRISYLKTMLLSAAVGATLLLTARVVVQSLPWFAAILSLAILGFAAVAAWSVTIGGSLALYRDWRDQRGAVDLFRELNRRRSAHALNSGGYDLGLFWGRLTRWLPVRPRFLVGDEVEVLSLNDIRRTLDSRGCLDALPFMQEMERFCGKRLRVFRHLDKIYDYGRSKRVRRVEDSYLLVGPRCDGSAHGGCQARCALIWKGAWLKPVSGGRSQGNDFSHEASIQHSGAEKTSDSPAQEYVCQFTELTRTSIPMRWYDVRQDVRPLVAGNVTLAAFLVVVFTQLFNAVQRWRGGVAYPPFPAGVLTKTTAVTHDLQPGDMVRVLGPFEIHRTLDKNNKNRGLWFDQDMLKHCGKDYRVLDRVNRIVDNITGAMRIMKSPCILLEHVEYSGEALRFCPQEEYLYWREAWLMPLAHSSQAAEPAQDRRTPLGPNYP